MDKGFCTWNPFQRSLIFWLEWCLWRWWKELKAFSEATHFCQGFLGFSVLSAKSFLLIALKFQSRSCCWAVGWYHSWIGWTALSKLSNWLSKNPFLSDLGFLEEYFVLSEFSIQNQSSKTLLADSEIGFLLFTVSISILGWIVLVRHSNALNFLLLCSISQLLAHILSWMRHLRRERHFFGPRFSCRHGPNLATFFLSLGWTFLLRLIYFPRYVLFESSAGLILWSEPLMS